MTTDEFKASTRAPQPPAGLTLALQALWWMEKGDWGRAHGLIDHADGRDECLVHAHLHRVEGDLANAGYWYRRAGRAAANTALDVERGEIIAALLGQKRTG
jgi:hypothetical protein